MLIRILDFLRESHLTLTAIDHERFSPDPYAAYTDPTAIDPAQLGYTQAVWIDVDKEIHELFRGYGTDIVYGKRGPSPCSAWRSERMLLNNEALSRFANRVRCARTRFKRIAVSAGSLHNAGVAPLERCD